MATCLAVMVVLVFGNVVLRYGFNSGITASEEISRWLFIYLTFIGAIVGLYEHSHLGVDTLVMRLPKWGKQLCFVVSHVLMLLATGMLMLGSWQQTLINLDNSAPATGLPMAIVYAAGLIFSMAAVPILLINLLRALTGRINDASLIMVKESEEKEVDLNSLPIGQSEQLVNKTGKPA